MDIGKNRVSLYLDITGHGRHKEYLKMHLFVKPKTYLDKKHNEETMRMAEEVRANRQLELQAQDNGLEYVAPGSQTFLSLFDQFITDYPNKDIQKYTGALYHFKEFQGEKPFFLTQKWVDDFKKYLSSDTTGLSGETPVVYLKVMKRICRVAYKSRVVRVNPDELNWKLKFDRHALRKEILNDDELRALAAAHCGNENVKRLFFFCCNTGLRFGDAKKLTWGRLKNYKLRIDQGKTGKYIYQEINDTARAIAGPQGPVDQPVFDLKGIDGINKVIAVWYKNAKLDKHITTHCARHTFCTNLMKNKVDHRTIIGLMGWSESSGMRQIMRYAHLVDENLKKAVDSLPAIGI